MEFVDIHDRRSSDYQNQWDTLVPRGFRPICVSVYGNVSAPLYAAVWVKRPGPPFVGIKDATAAQLQSFVDTHLAQGFSPSILTATGPSSNPIFACVVEESSHGSLTKYNLRSGSVADSGTIEYWINWARTNDFVPRWVASYGSASDRRFAIILEPNPTHVLWSIAGWWGEDYNGYEERFNAQVQQWARPALVTVAPDVTYLSVFREDSIGPWVARHGMTSSQYQAERNRWYATGMFPVYVQGGGSDSGTRFAALFATNDLPLDRVFTKTGTVVPAMSIIDSVVESWMRSNGTRGTAIAITQGGRLVFARGYTWAEPDYAPIEATSMFRIASCTKPITSIAIHQLIEQGVLSLTDTLQSILGLVAAPGGLMDTKFASIQVLNLLTHTGGLSGVPAPDAVAASYGFSYLPVTKWEVAGYEAGQSLQFTPGSGQAYSNVGFLLLGLIIQKKRGIPYVDAVRQSVFERLGLSRPYHTLNASWAQHPGTVRQHDGDSGGDQLRIAQSAVTGPVPGTRPLTPMGYGGEDYAWFDSFGGWCMAAVDYAKILAAFALGPENPLLKPSTVTTMWTVPALYENIPNVLMPDYTNGWHSWTEVGGVRGFQHTGGMPGVRSHILFRTDGWGFAVFCNGGQGWPDIYPHLTSLSSEDWPTNDLFPSVGIPAFPTVARLHAAKMKPKPLPDARPEHIRIPPPNTYS